MVKKCNSTSSCDCNRCSRGSNSSNKDNNDSNSISNQAIVQESQDTVQVGSQIKNPKVVKNRASSPKVTTAYYFIITLAYQELSANMDQMSATEQRKTMKLKTLHWISCLKKDYLEFYDSFGNDDNEREDLLKKLTIMVENDDGEKMIRKVKTEIRQPICNIVIPAFKGDFLNPSGNQNEGKISVCEYASCIFNICAA